MFPRSSSTFNSKCYSETKKCFPFVDSTWLCYCFIAAAVLRYMQRQINNMYTMSITKTLRALIIFHIQFMCFTLYTFAAAAVCYFLLLFSIYWFRQYFFHFFYFFLLFFFFFEIKR